MLKQSLQNGLLGKLSLDSQVELLGTVGLISLFILIDRLAKARKELLPVPQVPRINIPDALDAHHPVLSLKIRILKPRVFMQLHNRPNRESLLTDLDHAPFSIAVKEPVAVLTRVDLFGKVRKQPITEFELVRHLVPDLVDAVEELKKHLRAIARISS